MELITRIFHRVWLIIRSLNFSDAFVSRNVISEGISRSVFGVRDWMFYGYVKGVDAVGS